MISSIYFFYLVSCLGVLPSVTDTGLLLGRAQPPSAPVRAVADPNAPCRTSPERSRGEQQGWRLPVLGWTSLIPPVPDGFSSPWPFPTGNVPQELPLCAPSPGCPPATSSFQPHISRPSLFLGSLVCLSPCWGTVSGSETQIQGRQECVTAREII